MKKQKANHSPKQRALVQFIFTLIIFLFALFTWFKNEEKAERSKPQSEPKTSAVPSRLGNYDTVMANDNLGQNTRADVDYYQLALSWSPAFCDLQKRKNDGNIPNHLQYQCHDNEFGWVIHGLWPQSAAANTPADHPRFCRGDLPPESESLIKAYMPQSPGASLLQGQWEKHGACAFENAESYFAKQKALFQALTLPKEPMERKALFAWLKKHNPQLKNAYLGATKTELYICYDKSWNVMDCPSR